MTQKEIIDGKKKFRFNIIDALFILVIIAAIAAVVYFAFFSGSGTTSKTTSVEIEYTIELQQIRDEFKGDNFIKNGDAVVDAVNKYDIGEVISVAYENAKFTSVDADGNTITVDYPNHTNIIITVRATAQIDSGFYNVGGYNIMVGKQVDVRLPNFTGSGYCTTLTEVTK